MSHPSTNAKRSAADTADAVKPAPTWVRGKRAPRRRRTDHTSTLQLGVITLASNRHA